MDPDAPIPSIESDDLPHVDVLRATKTNPKHTAERVSIGTASSIPLPPSSPTKSPRKTPRLQRQTSSVGSPSRSPSYQSAQSSPSQNDWHSITPTLTSKRSTSNLSSAREITPSRQHVVRRLSSNLNTLLPSAMKDMPQRVEKKSIITAATVAKDYFLKELALHGPGGQSTQTVIFVHDSCYGHRFSRPKTSRAALSTIVERPERILATLLGVSAAYIRLGDRHADGRYGPHPDRDPSAIPRPPFTIRKTSRYVALSNPAVTHVHGAKWMDELQIMCDSAEGKLALNGKELVRPIGYGKDESGKPLPKLHEGDLYLCAESLDALQGCLGGVCDAVDTVFSPDLTKRAFVCIRPPGHHCSSDYPSGFCWLNNVHVGIAHAAITHGLTHAAIIDFDLHHGDGSQNIAWDHNREALTMPKNAAAHKKTPVGYFSLHDINSYPCEMGDEDKVRNASLCIENAHGQSIWNVHLQPWKDLAEFWKLYEAKYAILLEKTRVFLLHHTARFNNSSSGPKAKAAIFLSAGFDASEWEGAGMQRHNVNVPTDFYAKFTADVVKVAEEAGLGVDGRVISVLEGGYSDRALTSGVLSHVCGLTQVHESTSHYAKIREEPSSIDSQMGDMATESRIDGGGQVAQHSVYDANWWTARNLELLESHVGVMNPAPARKPKDKMFSNYTTPTESSTAKMTDHARERRSLSAQLETRMSLDAEPPQPSPAVDWATAAYELSHLIIPHDRQTLSCRHEDLNADATKARRERQSTIGIPAAGEEKMQLRDRKVKPAPYEAGPVRPKSRDGRRRTTVASVADLLDPEMRHANGEVGQANVRSRRRSSAASNIISGLEGMRIDDGRTDPASQSADDVKGNQSFRSSSVAAVKVTKAPAVKKPRAVGTVKPPAKSRSSPKKITGPVPPLPRVPSAFFNKDTNQSSTAQEIVTDEQRSSQTSSRTGGSVIKADDMESLAGGMKKMSIKLKVPSPEENAARERKALIAGHQKSRQPRKPAVAKGPKVSKSAPQSQINSPMESKTEESHLHQVAQSIASQVHVKAAEADNNTVEQEVLVPPAEPLPVHFSSVGIGQVSETRLSTSPQVGKMEETSRERSRSRTTSPGAITDINQAQTLDALPSHKAPFGQISSPCQPIDRLDERDLVVANPVVATRRTKAELPVFTSSSPIPFSNSSVSQEAAGRPRIVDDVKVDGLLNGVPEEGEEVAELRKDDPSIWDIPDTPQR